MIGTERRRGGAGQRAGQRQRREFQCRTRRGQDAIAAHRVKRRPHHLVSGDQRQHGGEAHLERDVRHLLWLEQHQAQRPPKPGHATKLPVCRPAPRRCTGTPSRSCARSAHACRSAPCSTPPTANAASAASFLVGQCRLAYSDAAKASRANASAQPMTMPMCKPGDRQQMRQARRAEGVMVGRRNAAGDPGQQRDRDRPGRPRHHRRNMPRDHFAQPLHQKRRTARYRLGGPLDRSQRIARATPAAEPRIALHVPGTGIGWRRGRPHQRPHRHRVAAAISCGSSLRSRRRSQRRSGAPPSSCIASSVTRRPTGNASTERTVPATMVAWVGRTAGGGARTVANWPDAKPMAAAASAMTAARRT